ncbi:MAG TPA: sporulation integral membrane protein YlbJ [Clostridium sp.]|uniref:sporulation integral membrane protein YlbJ n=1 Tax=unclassified Clostridium TaxID=2614128 RepID=UPI000EB99F70|nr:sporulation integral membrane protein YlbJ [Clostridium sp.]
MKVLLFIVLALIAFLIYLLLRKSSKNLLFTTIFSILIIYIILNPKSCISFTISGAKLFFYSVFPSLFPFLVIVNLIFAFGGIEIYSKILGKILCTPLRLPKECSVVILASLFCGYPLGSRYACELYERKVINKVILERLLNIATNGSPLFIIGTVGTAMLNSTFLGYILLISNALSCIIIGLILPTKKTVNYSLSGNSSVAATQIKENPNFGVALKNALEDATKTCLSIGSFVVIFSVIISIIKSSGIYHTAINTLCSTGIIDHSILDGLFLGFIEITNGCSIVATSNLSLNVKILICSFLIGFSGLSITFQVYSFVYKYKVSMKKYLSLKVVQGIICTLITLLFLKLPFSLIEQETFFMNNSMLSSKTGFLAILIFIFLLPVILKKVRDCF